MKKLIIKLFKLLFEDFFLKYLEHIINYNSKRLVKKISKKYPYKFDETPKIKKRKINYDLSIVIPSYCRYKKTFLYLEVLLEKLINALNYCDIKNFEIIILDNNSFKKLECLEKKFKIKNLKVYRNKKTLPAYKNWAKAISKSSGKFIFLHSDDDFIDKKFFFDFKKILKENNKVDIITWKSKPYVNNKICSFSWFNQWPRRDSGFFKPDSKLFKYPIPSSGYIARRSFYEKHGCIGSQEEGYDLACGIKFSIYAKRGYFASQSISYYRMHNLQSGRLDDPSVGTEKLNYFLNSTKSFFKFFHKKKAEQNILLYIKFYFFIHVAIDMLLKNLKNKKYKNNENIGIFLFEKYWNFKNFLFFKYIVPRLNLMKYMKKDIINGQPNFKF